MGANSGIEWTDATWNPLRGCTRVSEGCVNCYAEIMAARFSKPGQWGHGLAEIVKKPDGSIDHRWTGIVRAMTGDTLMLPLYWKKPRRIFVNSTSDLFHEALPDEAIDRVFAIMALSPQHTFQILTKRSERMREYLGRTKSGWAAGSATKLRVANDAKILAETVEQEKLAADLFCDPDVVGRQYKWPLPNVWLGVSAENQEAWNERIEHLGATPAAVRFVSAEPLLGPIDTGNAFDLPPDNSPYCPIDWVICGGESGPNARPMHPGWARSLRDQCIAAGTPFFFKQWGEWSPIQPIVGRWKDFMPGPECLALGPPMWPVGKGKAGRLLDGREWNEFPEISG